MFNHGLLNYFQKANHKLYMLASVFGVLLFLNGCGIIKSAELRALEEAASVLQLTTGREVRRSLQDKGTALGKPVYAKIIIVYEPINNHTRKEVYEEIVAILIKNNWEGSELNYIIPDSFSGSLHQGQFNISGGVNIETDRNLVIVIMTIY